MNAPVSTVKLGKVAQMTSGGTPPSSVSRYYGGGIPWVSIADMTAGGKYIRQTQRTLSSQGLAMSAAKLYEPGVILYAMYASLGECSLAVGRVSSSQAILGIKPGPSVDREYLYYFLQSVKSRVKTIGQQGTQANLNKRMVGNFDVPLPDLLVQRRVAGMLSDIDAEDDVLRHLIAKKRAIKEGMLHELLTGGSRLSSFTAEWEHCTVGQLLEFKNGLNKASDFFGHGTPIVNFMDVMRSPRVTLDRVHGLVSLSNAEIKRFSARQGDMFFTRTSETVEEVGTAAVLVEDIPKAVFSGFILRGRPISPGVDTIFLAYVFQLRSIRSQVTAKASYTTRALTNGGSLGRVEVELPSVDEQRTIVGVLNDAELEIEALERRLEATRAIKQGMLQELLTNRTKLRPTEGSR